MDPDPGGPKTCGSGSGTLIQRIEQQTYITYVAQASSGLELGGKDGSLRLFPTYKTLCLRHREVYCGHEVREYRRVARQALNKF
jgi:hypothetical protein